MWGLGCDKKAEGFCFEIAAVLKVGWCRPVGVDLGAVGDGRGWGRCEGLIYAMVVHGALEKLRFLHDSDASVSLFLGNIFLMQLFPCLYDGDISSKHTQIRRYQGLYKG